MRAFILTIVAFLFWMSNANAGLLNEYDSFVDFVNGLQIKQGMFYDAHASNWEHVVAGSIYDLYWSDFPVASFEAGYMVQDIGLGLVTLNISGLSEYAIRMPIGALQLEVGAGAGYDFRHHEPAYGVALFGFTWDFD